jgi:hypothetical protein
LIWMLTFEIFFIFFQDCFFLLVFLDYVQYLQYSLQFCIMSFMFLVMSSLLMLTVEFHYLIFERKFIHSFWIHSEILSLSHFLSLSVWFSFSFSFSFSFFDNIWPVFDSM